MNIAAKKCLQVLHYNVFGHEFNNAIKHTNQVGSQKKFRDFILKNPIIKSFLKGIDRKDEKVLLNSFKCTDFEPAERLIRAGTKDKSIIFVG